MPAVICMSSFLCMEADFACEMRELRPPLLVFEKIFLLR
jgi:hypothetical protein